MPSRMLLAMKEFNDIERGCNDYVPELWRDNTITTMSYNVSLSRNELVTREL